MSPPAGATPMSVDAHLGVVLSGVQALERLELTLADAHGCLLAEDVTAAGAIPPEPTAALVGYAVRVADVQAVPVRLPVVGQVSAGTVATVRLQPGFAVRMERGAVLPAGAEAVVALADSDGGSSAVVVTASVQLGQNVSPAGGEVSAGQQMLSAGEHLGAAQIGLLAAAGRARVRCWPRPRVVVVAAASGLVEAGQRVGPGQLPDVGSHALTAAAREAGAVAYRVGVVPEDPRRLLDALEDQLVRADLMIVIGGGPVVRQVLEQSGSMSYADVAMSPGGRLAFGRVGPDRTPVFCLPADTAEALIAFEVVVRPAVRRMVGSPAIYRPVVSASLAEAVTSPPGRRHFLPVLLERGPAGYQVAPMPRPLTLPALAGAAGLAVLAEQDTELTAGTVVPTMLLERRGR